MRKVILVHFILIVSVLTSFGQWQTNGNNIYYNNGNIGIGLNNPTAKLHVKSGLQTDASILATVGYSGLLIRSESDTNPGDVTFRILHDFTSYRENGFINFHRGSSANGGFLSFGSTGIERMRITPNGNIGIGTDNPMAKLHLGNINSQADALTIGTSNNNKMIMRSEMGASNGQMAFKLLHDYNDNRSNGFIAFYRGNEGGYLSLGSKGTVRMMIDETGNIGIGTSSPKTKLHLQSGSQTDAAILATVGHSGLYVRSESDTDPGDITFRILHDFTSYRENGFINFHRGSSANGGFLSFGSRGIERMRINETGNVGIGTIAPDHKLDVVGKIRAHEILVNTQKGADFVFEESYSLRPLQEVEQFIAENKHLPDIAPADSMMQNGVNMGEMQIKLLQKIEELTLYMIEQEKRIEQQEKEIREQKNTNKILEERVKALEK